MGTYCIRCKNCEYFLGTVSSNNFGSCSNKIIEVYTGQISPNINTRILILIPHDCIGILTKVHREWGCIEGLVKENIDKRRGKPR